MPTRHRLPEAEGVDTSDAGQHLLHAAGVIAALSIFLVFNVFLVPAMMSGADPMPLLVLDGAFALLLVSGFVVPAAILGRGRETLRRQALRDPRLAAALEAERLTWIAGTAVPMFGPL